MEVKMEDERSKRLLQMLRDLSKHETFITWRDEVVSSNIQQLENELASDKADTMPEVVLRAKIKQLNSLRYLFYTVFEIAKENINISKEK
jgi:hypothetical protein